MCGFGFWEMGGWVRWRWGLEFLGVWLGWGIWDGLVGGLRYQCWRYVVELNVISFEELELFGIYITRRLTAKCPEVRHEYIDIRSEPETQHVYLAIIVGVANITMRVFIRLLIAGFAKPLKVFGTFSLVGLGF